MAKALRVRINLDYFYGRHMVGEIDIPLDLLNLRLSNLSPAKCYEKEVTKFVQKHLQVHVVDFT
jgi:hypothetical protein